ncbi:MAG: glycogen/starch/alpha-glucan phosphorylase [Spirochaetota bacterium]
MPNHEQNEGRPLLAGLTPSTNPRLENDPASLQLAFVNHLEFSQQKDEYSATPNDLFRSLALAVRDRLVERWVDTQQTYYRRPAKRVYYLSLEFLMGRALGNALLALGIGGSAERAMRELGLSLEELEELEYDAGLGNGGLGRLAACFLDSMATLGLPAYGYGIRYEYGIFFQRIRDGWQVETPDNWLRYGNPWEVGRPEHLYPVRFYGRVRSYRDDQGRLRHDWVDTEQVMAMAYDTAVPGFRNGTVNTLRLWAAKSTREFDLDYFNHGDYERAVWDKDRSETISKVLYPNDNLALGKELRLKQEYFFVSATLQDILRRYRKLHPRGWDRLPEEVAVQLNDTHPAVAVAELMRILVDRELLGWEEAWDITVRVFGYTNHTILPEALEKWPVSLFERLLPRHLEIIHEINRRFLEEVAGRWPGDVDRLRRVSLIEEGPEKRVRMAHLALVGSHAVNGVSALHTDLLRARVFRDFHEMWPGRFVSLTNGITQRRWLGLCNPGLSALITEAIGDGWLADLDRLRELAPLAGDPEFKRRWLAVKEGNKQLLAGHIRAATGIEIYGGQRPGGAGAAGGAGVAPAGLPGSSIPPGRVLFDCQVKRIHEYKRQLLNVLHTVWLYNRIAGGGGAHAGRWDAEGRWAETGRAAEQGQAAGPGLGAEPVPRVKIFAGKAAPGYARAKLIIKLITAVADRVNADPAARGRLMVVFLENYGVSLAQRIIPAADLSEQISTAGTEASGTGNMKFALNGALTVGTLDGANVEIAEEVGRENLFIFGHDAAQVEELKTSGYDPRRVYRDNPELREVLDMIGSGVFSPGDPGLFAPIVDSLLAGGDPYLHLADFPLYIACQERVDRAFRTPEEWARLSILNVAGMGKFSSDRTVREYAEKVWQVAPVPVEEDGR